ncbi:hypothetical protein [Shimazuella alba]|uniref:Uncharacterized protein n=1 Tax=Shimazuella alba TaxID=2690964 RepID=A0A6I4VXN7_9BACL|nr:hypothetical protein [Shimazuella alba]MXQ55471.1 hypothetical protein [Shimazuella alba]
MVIFTGYCFTEDGEREHQVDLEVESEVFQYANIHRLTYPRVVIIDRLSEIVVLEIRDGKIFFPEEWQGRKPWKISDENK